MPVIRSTSPGGIGACGSGSRHLTVLGGCCGTDHRHIEHICDACLARGTGACLMITFLEPTITVAASADRRARLADIIARAFAADPPSRWLYPDDDQYLALLPAVRRSVRRERDRLRHAEIAGGRRRGRALAAAGRPSGRGGARRPPRGERRPGPPRHRVLAVRADGQPPSGRTALVSAAHRRPRRRSRVMATARCSSSTPPPGATATACRRISSRRAREAYRCIGDTGSRWSRRFETGTAPPIFPMVRMPR